MRQAHSNPGCGAFTGSSGTSSLPLAKALLAKDKYTQNHSYRVSVYSAAIAHEMRMDSQPRSVTSQWSEANQARADRLAGIWFEAQTAFQRGHKLSQMLQQGSGGFVEGIRPAGKDLQHSQH